MRRVDRVSLIAGLAMMAVGGLLVLDQTDAIELSPGIAGAALAAALGVIMITSGLADDGH
ncbi:MAG TPA: hypothetical protein VHJ54_11315 [Solirubrobacterales bacterium]|jgi:hypothetical protein|nr:hypothetical protein [Solirubrobacterales bacterium]